MTDRNDHINDSGSGSNGVGRPPLPPGLTLAPVSGCEKVGIEVDYQD